MDSFEAVRKRREEMQDVAILSIREATDAPDLDTGRGELLFTERSLDAVLDLIGQLGATHREELDPVVWGRIV